MILGENGKVRDEIKLWPPPWKLSVYATGLKCLEFLNPVNCNYVKQDN